MFRMEILVTKDLVNMEFASQINNKEINVKLMETVELDYGVHLKHVNLLSLLEVFVPHFHQFLFMPLNVDTKHIVLTQNVSCHFQFPMELIHLFKNISNKVLQTDCVNQDGQMYQIVQHGFVSLDL